MIVELTTAAHGLHRDRLRPTPTYRLPDDCSGAVVSGPGEGGGVYLRSGRVAILLTVSCLGGCSSGGAGHVSAPREPITPDRLALCLYATLPPQKRVFQLGSSRTDILFQRRLSASIRSVEGYLAARAAASPALAVTWVDVGKQGTCSTSRPPSTNSIVVRFSSQLPQPGIPQRRAASQQITARARRRILDYSADRTQPARFHA